MNKIFKILMFLSILLSSSSSSSSLLLLLSSSSSSSSLQLTTTTTTIDNNILDYERDALQDLYISTHGDHWRWNGGKKGKWNFTNSNVNPCDEYNVWQGLNCTNISSIYYITHLNLTEYNLIGTLPDSIGNFSMLT